MRYLNKLSAILFSAFLLFGCADLAVDNKNNPSTEDVISSFSDVEALVSNQYLQWWNGTQKNYPGMTLSVMAMEGSSSWGNFGMWQLSRFPREAFVNDPSAADRFMSSTPWSNMYTAISGAVDGLQLISNPNITAPTVEAENRMKSFANFVLGISHGFIANHFDQGFVVDENTDLVTLQFSPYNEVLDAAIAKLDLAISQAPDGSFASLPSSWINGNAFTPAQFRRVMNAYAARFIVSNPRTTAEYAQIDWQRVLNYTNAAITDADGDFIVQADGELMWSRLHSLMQDATWHRASPYLIGRTDESGNFTTWLNTPIENRDQILITTSDRRIAGQEASGDLIPKSTVPGTDFRFVGPAAFNPARGTWYRSFYRHYRNQEMYLNGFVGPMQHLRVAEVDLMRAEALWNLNKVTNRPQVVALVNKYRVGRGGLAPITIADSDNVIFSALRYEFEIETYSTAAGLAFYRKRGWGHLPGTTQHGGGAWGGLPTGTVIHFPVPAGELDLLGLVYYTFGGVGNAGAAPKTRSFQADLDAAGTSTVVPRMK
jgi:hypothetical protein